MQIFWASFLRSPTSGMVVSSSHQWGVCNWWAHQSSHICSSLSMVLVGNPTYLQCPSRLWASLGDVPIPAFRWAGGLHCLPSVALWSNALMIPCGAFHPKASPPQGNERSQVSPVYAGSETSHAYPETYPNVSCGGVSTGCSLFPGSVYQYLPPACRWLPMPTGEPPWLPRGLHCEGSLSLRTGSGILFGSWAMGWPQQPLLSLLQHGSTSSSLQVAPQGRQDVSFCEVWYPTSCTAGISASGFGLGRPCQWPQQINLSTSFCPSLAACMNILWRMMGQCSQPTSHLGYSFKNNSALR